MSDINEIALNAVYQKGYERGRHECWDELKGGKRWWLFWPMTLFTGFFGGAMTSFAVYMCLNHLGRFHP